MKSIPVAPFPDLAISTTAKAIGDAVTPNFVWIMDQLALSN
ncbi:hypothetical protein [Xanthomonas arboricola]|nr:hypothetical protein [Xanthomonas arboricola]